MRNFPLFPFKMHVTKVIRSHINTFTVDDEYFRHNMENLPLPIQMQFSKKQKTKDMLLLCYFFIAILESTLNL